MNPDPNTTLYYDGLPLVGERELTGEERTALRKMARRGRWTGCLLALVAPTGFLLGMAALSLVAETWWTKAVSILLFVAGLAIAFVILQSRDNLRAARAMRASLKTGRVQQFGKAEAPPLAFEEWSEDDESGEDEVEEPTTSIEILAAGGLLWRVNGRPPFRYRPVETTAVPNPPDFAATAAEWMQPWTDPHGTTTWWNERDLSTAERAELRRHTRRAALPYIFLPFLTAYVGIGYFAGDLRESLFTSLWMLAFVGWADYRAVRALPHALRVRRDAKLGKVAIFRAEAEHGPVTEFLPFSRLVWTQDGHPAAWRRT